MGRVSPRRLPAPVLACALVALLNGFAWSMLTPPFHVPDENAHVAYVQDLAETGHMPLLQPQNPGFSPELNATLAVLSFYKVIGQSASRPPLTAKETAQVRQVERGGYPRVGGDAATATNNPPLYYALAAVPYLISPSHDLLDRLVLMRLLSVLLGAMTAGVVVLFLRELLPRAPWAWTVGGLLAALQPMFGFMSGGVNADALLYLLSALTILASARILRRGLTARSGALLGATVIAGILTKPAYYGLLPGVGVALLAALVQQRGAPRRRPALAGTGAAAAVAGAVFAIYWTLAHTVMDRVAMGATRPPGTYHDVLRERVSFMWQLFFPRLPTMDDLIPGFPLRDLWNAEFTGRFGWLDYGFPQWVYDISWWVIVALGVLAVVTLVRRRATVAARVLELVTYVAFVVGVLFTIAYQDYTAHVINGAPFEQGRYLLPLLALWAGLIVVALRGLGDRAGRAVGAVLVVAMLATSVFGQLLTVARFYG